MKKIFSLSCLLILFCFGFSANFTPGNIVVLRVGDGSAALSSSAAAVFLDEYTTTGTLVQSIAVPTAASGNNHALTLSGSASSEGALTLSVNGQYLSFAGYDAATGFAKVSTDSTINRTVGYVGANGVVNTSTGFLVGSAYVKNNIRGAVTNDGTLFWTAGNATGSKGGPFYLPAGSFTSSPVQVSSTETNTRAINIFGGQLYTTSGSSSYHGVNAVGTGLPVTTGQTMTNLPGMPGADTASSSYGFWLFDENANVAGYDVMYICDDHTVSPNGGLYKYSLVNGTWVLNGNIPDANGLRGITATQSCSGIQLYVADENNIYSLADNSGYNGALSGSLSTIASASTNTIFHGVAFAPGSTASTGVTASVASATNVACNGQTNGSINLSVSGGTSYTYAWSDGSVTTENRTNLAAGTYTVTVSSSGCTATASATITQPTVLHASPSVTNVSCYGGSNGAVTVTVTGGTPTYTFSPSTLTGLSVGNYNVTVTDANACTATVFAHVSQPAAIAIVDTITNLPCNGGGSTGAVNIGVTGGTPAYTYVWSNNSHTQDINNLTANTYSVTITDANSCSASLTAIVSNAGSLVAQSTVVNVTCNGLSNGSINITTSGGTAPYQYDWSNTTTTENLTNVVAGNYILTVSDNAGCTLISSISITQPSALTVVATATDITCFGTGNGAIELNVTGGTSPYSYVWTGTSDNGQNIGSLAAGNYSVVATDANSCSTSASATITQPTQLTGTAVTVNASAFGASDGSITLTVSGGTAPYNYSWSNSETSTAITGLAAATYCVTVADHNNCTIDSCITVSQPTGITQLEWMQKFITTTIGNSLMIDVTLTQDMNCNVQIFDLTGSVIYTSPESVFTSNLHLQLPDDRMASGCYLVRVTTAQGSMSKKVVITR